MKIIIASDIHGSDYYLSKLIEIKNKFKINKLFLLGDLYYSGARNIPPKDYYPINIVKKLNDIKDEIIAVKGNCESDIDLKVSSNLYMSNFYVGGLVGLNSGTIKNCNIYGTILVNGKILNITTGGVSAYNTGNIIDTKSLATVSTTAKGDFAQAPTANAGGIAGYKSGTMQRCASLNNIIIAE